MFVAQGLAPMPPASIFRRRVRGPGTDEPLVWYEGSSTSDRRWLLADERGSVIAVTNSAGAAQAINSYDAYGIPASSNLGRFQYTGQAWIAEIGMYDYKARTYSATLGRFLQTDPIGYGDGMNMYAYVGNDPVNATDPSGMVIELVHQPVRNDGVTQGDDITVTASRLPRYGLDSAPLGFGSSGSDRYFGEGGGGGGGARQSTPQKAQDNKPAYCSSLGYQVGDFIDSKLGNGVKVTGAGTVLAGGAVGLATAFTGVGVGAGGAIAGVGGLIYAGGTAVSTVGNGIKWLSGQSAGVTAVGLLSVPTMNLGPVSQIAVDQSVSYFGGKAVKNPCD